MAELTAKDTFRGSRLSLNLPEIRIKSMEIEKGINNLYINQNTNIVAKELFIFNFLV